MFSDKLFSYDGHMTTLGNEIVTKYNDNHRVTNDISGELGYYDFNNARYIDFSSCFGMFGRDTRKIFGFEDFETIKFPKIYAPKCPYFKINNRTYDYTDGIFYTPGGNPYEILPDAINFYDEDIYRSRIYPSGKKLYYVLYLTNTVNADMLVESFPINSTGTTGMIEYGTTFSPPTLTSAQKSKLTEKGWSVSVY